jgi:hypothetical protein
MAYRKRKWTPYEYEYVTDRQHVTFARKAVISILSFEYLCVKILFAINTKHWYNNSLLNGIRLMVAAYTSF